MAASLRVTKRCLVEDLGFSKNDLDLAIEKLAGRDPLIAAFFERRSKTPEGQETLQGLTSKIVAYSLHSGDHRGATWHDRSAGVVWLLAACFHRSGQPDDAYPYFTALDTSGRLLPTREDYLAFTKSQAASLARSLLEEVPPIVEAARHDPGVIQEGVIGGRVRVRVVQEDGDPPMRTVAISQRLFPGAMEVPHDWQIVVAASVLPDTTPPEDLSFAGDLAGQPLREDEIAYCDFAHEA